VLLVREFRAVLKLGCELVWTEVACPSRVDPPGTKLVGSMCWGLLTASSLINDDSGVVRLHTCLWGADWPSWERV
jgi:hypothetical protein